MRALLADSDSRARARAALAAGRIADPAAIPALRALLADAAAAGTAAWALGRIPGGEAALLECLATSNSSPTSTPPCAAPAEAARALGFGPRGDAVPAALAAALAGPADLAAAAATALGVLARTGGKGADAAIAGAARAGLEAALIRGEPAVRAGAAYALGRVPRGAAPAALAAVLRDREPEARALAARAWGKQGGSVEALAPLLRDADWRVRVEAARALALVPGGSSAIAAALPLAAAELAQRDAAARWTHPLAALLEAAPAAQLAAGSLPAPPSLSGPTAASTAAARCAAALARDRIAGRIAETPGCAAGLEPDWRGRMRTGTLAAEMAERDGAARTAAAAALRDPDGRVRGAAAGAAGAALADELRSLLDDPDPFVVAEAAGSLAKEPALAAASIPAALRAVRRLAPARMRPAGDAEADALASLAQLLGAADTRAAEAVPALLSLQPAGSPFLHRALVEALRALHGPAPQAPPPAPAVPAAAAAEGFPGSPARPRFLRLRTTAGDLTLGLRSSRGEAPLTSAAIATLARRGFYADLGFHRVVPDFVVQGGDPRGDGDGGPGWALPDEHTPLRFVRGSVGIATNGPETGGSQLFLCHSAQPHLDGRYTLFAELRAGAAVMDALQVGDRILEASSE